MNTLLPLVLIDLLCLVISLSAANLLLDFVFPGTQYAWSRQLPPLLGLALIIFPFARVYSICGLHPGKEIRAICNAELVLFTLLLLANQLVGEETTAYEISLIVLSLVIALAIHPLMRIVGRSTLARQKWWGWSVIVVGSGDNGHRVLSHFRNHPMLAMRPIGWVDLQDLPLASEREHAILSSIRLNHGPLVVVAGGDAESGALQHVVDVCSTHTTNVIIIPTPTSLPTLWTETHDYGGLMGLHARAKLLSAWRLRLKRVMDILLIVAAAPLLLPVFLGIALAIVRLSPGPVFFAHQRIGRNGRRFHAWKFRSMVPDADAKLQHHLEQHPELRLEWDRDHKLKNDPRIIPGVGHLIRKLSLDELPQLWNVLKGEMSLVGPRPIVEAEIAKYEDVFPLYLKVTPGITGLWQVSGRNNTSYEDRINYDAYYVRNWSPWLDLYILARTIKTVVMREGAY